MLVKVAAKQKVPRIFLVEAKLSDRQLFSVLRCTRATFGKSFIQKGIKSALHDRKNLFESLFEVKKIPMEPSGGAITLHSIVCCLDVDLVINRIAALHSKTVNDFRIKFGIYYGQSFLKVTITLSTASRNSSGP